MRFTPRAKRHYSMSVNNLAVAYGLLVNQICDNTMLFNKEFIVKMLCLQLRMTETRFMHKYVGGSHSKFLPLEMLWILDNDFVPFAYHKIHSGTTEQIFFAHSWGRKGKD